MADFKSWVRRVPYLSRLYGQRERARNRVAAVAAQRRAALASRDEARVARDEARAANAAAIAEAARLVAQTRAEAAAEIDRIAVRLRARAAANALCRTHEEHATLRRWFADMVPWVAEGLLKLRIGADRDGGYVMVEDFEGVAGAVSAGIGPEVSWDLAIARRGIPVVQYDHTVAAPPESHALFTFHASKLVPEGSDEPGTATLSGILGAPPFDRGGDAILKMDIEHDEWIVLDAAAPADLSRFRQIVLEFHALERFDDPEWRARALRVTAKLAATHRAIHFHGNNFGPFVVVGNMALPRVFEVSWLRADDRRFAPGDRTCPGLLDKPNNPAWPDLTFSLPPPA